MEIIYYYILTIGIVIGLWWLWFFEFKELRLCKTRQQLFSIRDDLFNKASEGVISFDDRAYGITRTTLNGMIRFAHELSFLKMLAILIVAKRNKQNPIVREYRTEWEDAFKSLENQAAQKAIAEAHMKMHLVILSHVISRSLILSIVIIPLGLFARIFHKRAVDRSLVGVHKTRTPWTVVDAEANHIGAAIA